MTIFEWLNNSFAIMGKTFSFTTLEFLLRFLFPFLLFSVGGLFILILTRFIGKKLGETGQKISGRIGWGLFFLLVAAGIGIPSLYLFQYDLYKVLGRILFLLNEPFYSSGNTAISFVTLILVIPVIICASWAGNGVRRILSPQRLKRFGLNALHSFSLIQLLRYVVMTLILLFGLTIIGIDLSAIGVLFGVLGIGIGFGMQSFISDFFAGVRIMTNGLLKEGDLISVEGNDGFVKSIRLMQTELTTFENETLIIPNSSLTHTIIHSYTYLDHRIIMVNSVSVSYDSDLDAVIEILREVATRNPWRQSADEIQIRVIEFADSGISMELRTCIKDMIYQREAKSWTNLEIWRAFKKSGIEIPFPQRVLHFHNPDTRPDAVVANMTKYPKRRMIKSKYRRKVWKSKK